MATEPLHWAQLLAARVTLLLALGSGIAPASVVLTIPPEPLQALRPSDPPVEIDFDGDGEFELTLPGNNRQINVILPGETRLLAFDQLGTILAADIADGAFIGIEPQGEMLWVSGGAAVSACFSGGGVACFGNFLGGIEYFGVEFDIDGATHFGWVEVESSEFFPLARVHRWAYETIPETPIFAGRIPEPTAPCFLFSSGVILLLRRRRS